MFGLILIEFVIKSAQYFALIMTQIGVINSFNKFV